MMRVSLDDDFKSTTNTDQEKVFQGYNFELTSAYYPSKTKAYAVGYDRNDYMTYVI